jgi:hypothetical protein
MIELIMALGFVISQMAVFGAAYHNGLRAGRFATVSAIGYIAAWIFGELIVSASVGEKAPLGSALGWIAVSFAGIAFLKPKPQQSQDPTGILKAVWALSWRGILAVMLASWCGALADFFVFFLTGLLRINLAPRFLDMTVYAAYIATCIVLSLLLFHLATKNRLGAVHSRLTLILRQESVAGGSNRMTSYMRLLGINLVILLALGLLYFGLKVHSYRGTVKNAKVLICSLGDNPLLTQTAERDAEIYRRHFPTVSVLKAEKLTDLLSALKSGNFNILHLVKDFDRDGRLIERQATYADVAPLFELCRAKHLLFVYLAGGIPQKNQAAVYKSTGAARIGHDFPLVITTDRGTEFSLFLDRLLQAIANGEFLGNAWLEVRPQDSGSGAPQPAVDRGPRAVVLL